MKISEKSQQILILAMVLFAQCQCFGDERAVEKPVPVLGEPSFGGAGCKKGTASALLSPDGEALSIIFDDFTVKVGNGALEDSKECSLRVPMTLPPGYRLHVVTADFRGFNFLPEGAKAEFQTLHDFVDSENPRKPRPKKFAGPLNEDFTDTVPELVKSRCNGKAVVRFDLRLSVKTNPHRDPAFSQLDSQDLSVPNPKPRKPKRMMGFQLKLKPCDAPGP